MLRLERIRCNENTIIGTLSIDNADGPSRFLCWTLENANKAIPKGTYGLDHETISPKFGSRPFYERVCGGKLPRLKNVPHRNGILIHCGNTFLDSSGCILVGVCIKQTDPFRLKYSCKTFENLLPELRKHQLITIK